MESKKGISLIVLVITIIVIIVLAVAVILTIANNNPIENARKARFLNDLSAIQDEVNLTIAENVVESKGSYKVEDFKESDLNALSTVAGTRYENELTVTNGRISLKSNSEEFSKKEIEWATSEGYAVSDGGSETAGVTPGVIVTESAKEYTKNGTAVIPIGFAIVPGLDDVSKGLVISDKANDTTDEGNQYVWIPVEVPEGKTFDEVFVRENGYYNGASQTNVDFTKCTEPYSYNGATANATETAEYNSMLSSVEKYKGFYIARYEASEGSDGKAKSIKGKMPWTNIGWNNDSNSSTRMQTQTGGCVEKARAIYPVASATKGSAVSTLIYGVQWDTALNYITDNDEEKKKNSTDFGNHKDSESFEYTKEDGTTGTKTKDTGLKIPTGSTTRNQLKNVYDMAGNVYEWTMEAFSSNIRVFRGGCFNGSGIFSPVSNRLFSSPYYTNDNVGFRVALYIAE